MAEKKLRKQDERYTVYDFDIGGLVLSVTILHPKQATSGHSHDYSEAYFFSSGQGELQLDEDKKPVHEGHFTHILSNQFHRVYNTGDTDLVLICAWKIDVREVTCKCGYKGEYPDYVFRVWMHPDRKCKDCGAYLPAKYDAGEDLYEWEDINERRFPQGLGR
ncbi:cupin domain-containing protein [Chloroflexota bacterium]